jgi:hypothetical protein
MPFGSGEIAPLAHNGYGQNATTDVTSSGLFLTLPGQQADPHAAHTEKAMNLIDTVSSKNQLLAIRDHFQSTLKHSLGSRLGKAFGQRNFDELTAKLLGSTDFNTAIGVVTKHTQAEASDDADHYSVASEYNGFCAVIAGLLYKDYISENELYDVTDEVVFDQIGTSKSVSNNINNQGYEKQLYELNARCAISALYFPLSEVTGLTLPDLKRCVLEATRSRVKVFDVSQCTGY